MVRIFSVYHFSGQMVDTIDDTSACTITKNNKLLIAQADYTIEVKDLLTDKKTPIFVFPTVDQVQDMTHCDSGNYVATLEGKQTFQKSDVLIVRVYTNWEADSVVNDPTRSVKQSKRFVRPRIAGVVTPSSAKTDDDYLDMIEIPISFMSPTTISCCQKTGRLLIACGPTIHLFNQVYTRGHHNKSHLFMDFIPLFEVFELNFQPTLVNISENVVSAYCSDKVSVFKLTKVQQKFFDSSCAEPAKEIEKDCSNSNSNIQHHPKDKRDCKAKVDGALNIDRVLEVVSENRENELFGIVDPSSLPIMVHLKEINDDVISMKEKRFPFKILNRNVKYDLKNGKIKDNFVTTLCDKDLMVVAESLLALELTDHREPISRIDLQVLSRISNSEESDVQNRELFCVDSDQFIGIHVILTTFQEGFLFHATDKNIKEGLQCVAVFNFTAQVISVMYESYFLHVLTQAGMETYNLPTFHSMILDEKPNPCRSSKYISILGIQPFIGVIGFIGSKDFITIFTSASDEKKGKKSLPWTVYSLRVPGVYQIYEEMVETSREIKQRDSESYKYLLLEAFLLLQTAFQLRTPLYSTEEEASIRTKHVANAMELAELFFKSEDENDVMKGASIIVASGANAIEFIRKFENDIRKSNVMVGILYLFKTWIQLRKNSLTVIDFEWIIEFLGQSGETKELAVFLLSNEDVCRSSGHKAMQYLQKYFVTQQAESDVHVLFALCILHTQVCLQDKASDILKIVQAHPEKYQQSFTQVALQHWIFLFDMVSNNEENLTSFSELTSLLIENLPEETCQILAELILKKKQFTMLDIVQMLLKQFPCHVSVQKGHLVLQTLLELIFSSKLITDFNEPSVNNCLKILMRSYLTQLLVKEFQDSDSPSSSYRPIFVESLPDYVQHLPIVYNTSYKTLRKLQELVWSKMLNEEIVKEIVETLPNIELKLNILAMLNQFDFVKELMKNNYTDAIVPYSKISFGKTKKKWRDLLVLVQSRISELKDTDRNSAVYEEILSCILDHLACNMSPLQLHAIMEPTLPKTDGLYQKYIMRAQQVAYANDVKELIINTSQQLLHPTALF